MWPKRCQVSAVVVAVTQTRVHIKKDTTFKQAATAKWTRPRVGYNNYTHHASLPPLSTYLARCLVVIEAMFWALNQILDKHAAESDTRRVRECEYRKIRFYAFTVITYNSDNTFILYN